MIIKNGWFYPAGDKHYSRVYVDRINTKVDHFADLIDGEVYHDDGEGYTRHLEHLERIQENNQDQNHLIEKQVDAPLWKFAEKESRKFEKEEELGKFQKEQLQKLGFNSMEEFWHEDLNK